MHRPPHSPADKTLRAVMNVRNVSAVVGAKGAQRQAVRLRRIIVSRVRASRNYLCASTMNVRMICQQTAEFSCEWDLSLLALVILKVHLQNNAYCTQSALLRHTAL